MKKEGSVSLVFIFFLVLIGSKVVDAYRKAEFKEAHPYPKTTLVCNCMSGIPIYDSWSVDRKVEAYAPDGEVCEVHSVNDEARNKTLEPNAAYKFIDYKPHLYVACPSGHGFVYTSQTTYPTQP